MSVQSTEIASEALIPSERDVSLGNGKFVRVHTLRVGGLFKVIGAIRRAEIKEFPVGLSLTDLLEPEQRRAWELAETPEGKAAVLKDAQANLTPDKRLALLAASTRKIQAMLEWVCASEKILPAFLSAVSNLSEQEASDLQLHEMFAVATAALDLFNVDATVEAGAAFFTHLGGLTKAIGKQSENRQAASDSPV